MDNVSIYNHENFLTPERLANNIIASWPEWKKEPCMVNYKSYNERLLDNIGRLEEWIDD